MVFVKVRRARALGACLLRGSQIPQLTVHPFLKAGDRLGSMQQIISIVRVFVPFVNLGELRSDLRLEQRERIVCRSVRQMESRVDMFTIECPAAVSSCSLVI